MSKKDAATLIVCALILVLACIWSHSRSLRSVPTDTPNQIQLDIPLNDGMSGETVIYSIDSEVE